MTLRLPMIINGMLSMWQYLIAQSMPLYAWKYKNVSTICLLRPAQVPDFFPSAKGP